MSTAASPVLIVNSIQEERAASAGHAEPERSRPNSAAYRRRGWHSLNKEAPGETGVAPRGFRFLTGGTCDGEGNTHHRFLPTPANRIINRIKQQLGANKRSPDDTGGTVRPLLVREVGLLGIAALRSRIGQYRKSHERAGPLIRVEVALVASVRRPACFFKAELQRACHLHILTQASWRYQHHQFPRHPLSLSSMSGQDMWVLLSQG